MASISEERKEEIRAKLILIEQDIINDLIKEIKDPDPVITVKERTSLANAIAYHVACLSKLLGKEKEEKPKEEDLATWLSSLPKKYRVRLERIWKRLAGS